MSAAFKFFDSNGNQTISVNEFISGLERIRIKVSENEANKLFSYMDSDHNG